MGKSIITSGSNRFFPSLLNLIGSIKANYPNHPKIYVYSLGLLPIFKKELRGIENLEIIEMPHFCNFWRSCYTWKTYIFNHPVSDYNLYLDAGTQVLRPLDEMFQQIEGRGYFTVNQEVKFGAITPTEYESIAGIGDTFNKEVCVAAGIFGFSRMNASVRFALDQSYQAALVGLCLGWSKSERHRNRGKDKSIFIRNCEIFRHDQTLLNIFFRKHLGNFYVNDLRKYGGLQSAHDHPEQVIWHLRKGYFKLEYADNIFKKNRFLKKALLQAFFLFHGCKKLTKSMIKKYI